MAKGIGLIGNFKGKVGNMVGYKLTDSNSGNTQGIRVYQPIVKNPKTAAQAEQRAKLAPINATYRALKMVIDRGNEGLTYGNKSRLAWLKQAFMTENMPWILKGENASYPVGCPLTKGSLSSLSYGVDEDSITIHVDNLQASAEVDTIGKVSQILLNAVSFLKAGDQLTFIQVGPVNGALNASVFSFVLDVDSTQAVTKFTATTSILRYESGEVSGAGAVIVSREGANGEHLRSNENINVPSDWLADVPYDATSKTAAIESYMSSAAVNSDWAEESIQ